MLAPFDYDLFTVASVLQAKPHPHLLPELRLSSITTSSLEAKPGSLFVPLVDKRDGHDFIIDACKRGASAFLVRQGHRILHRLDAEQKSRAISVPDPLVALGQLAAFHRNRFTPLVIGVTGSNGKTTTKEMLLQIFREALDRQAIATEKNYNNHIGVPFTLFRIGRKTRVAVVEMGMNHAGEISYLSKMARPHHAIISSIGHAHIEFLGSRVNIARAKSEITDGMPEGGALFVPKNVAEYQTISRKARQDHIELRRIDAKKNAVFRITSASAHGFTLAFGKKEVRFPFANAAWLSNLALSAAVAADAGIQPEDIATAVQKFRAPAGRMQVQRGYFTIIDDGYNANPDSAVASIDAALQQAEGRPVICVFGDFKELGRHSRMLHEFTGRQAAKAGVAAFYGVGEDMRHAVRAFKANTGSGRAFLFRRDEVDQLVTALCSEPKGAIILVKGSRSLRMEEIVGLIRSATHKQA